MEWHINDLSLNGQFPDPQSFKTELEFLLQFRMRNSYFRQHLYCSRSISERKITRDFNFIKAIQSYKDKNYIRLVLEWINKSGPFWDDRRQHNEEDYFVYQSIDVTDQGLGEAARRKLVEIEANVFSFSGSEFPFNTTPLQVQQGLPEDPIDTIFVENYWEIEKLRQAIESVKIYRNWLDVEEEILCRYEGLIISENAMESMKNSVPYNENVKNRILELLKILNKLVMESDIDGKLSTCGLELKNMHFEGEKARFTDESDSNKLKYKDKMTFSDPSNTANKIFCPWHGKIKTPQIRIHFEWPRPPGQNKIKIVYIGEKITKK